MVREEAARREAAEVIRRKADEMARREAEEEAARAAAARTPPARRPDAEGLEGSRPPYVGILASEVKEVEELRAMLAVPTTAARASRPPHPPPPAAPPRPQPHTRTYFAVRLAGRVPARCWRGRRTL